MISLRTRVSTAAVLWTVGLVGFAIIAVQFSRGAYSAVIRVHDYHLPVAIIAMLCLAAGFTLARRAFLPFDDLRVRLAAVQRGVEPRLSGVYPPEVQPLVDDLNNLLVHNEDAIARASAKAGDLAHGLKTPLAVLSNEADRLAAAGHDDLSGVIALQVGLMRRQVDYHLAHARAAASGASLGARCAVSESAEGLTRTLERLYAAKRLTIAREIAAAHAVKCRREDLDEMLGNLLDNACKWAASRVVVASHPHSSGMVIDVDDDGPGIPEGMRRAVLQRGVRADTAAPGSGLGLAIVQDLASLHGGTIALDRSPLGGTRARLQLPAAG